MLDQNTQAGVQSLVEADARIRQIAQGFLVPKEGSEESKDARRMANGFAAAEVVISIYNIFQGLRNPSENAMYSLMNDLTLALNTNPFWVQHAGALMTLFIAAVNCANDARQLKLENDPRWKDLETQSRNMWVEIMPYIIFQVHGYAAMRATSLTVKKTFLGLMYG